jgi:hypothetical protein
MTGSPPRKRRAKPGRLKGAAMAALRAQCFERDGYVCHHQIGWTDILGVKCRVNCCKRVTWDTGHMAHIISRGRGGKDELSNVVTKCAACHIGIEHSYGPSGVKPVPKKAQP